jgi:electron transfer flavoprotein-quinone oxidoreductase
MEKVDAVVVGGGLSGLSCAYRLAEKDMQVIVLERGDFAGSKNVTGGRLYLMPIKDLAGDILDGAPFERKVVKERWSLQGENNSLSIDLNDAQFRNEDHSFTVLRAILDRWLAEKVMAKGGYVIPKYRVDDLLCEGGAVTGIKAGAEEIWANVVVASDGALSFIAEKAGLREKLSPGRFAVAIKEVIQLPEEKINDRFNVEKGQGCAQLFVGDVTKGLFGGGFLYTNRESVSLGIVIGIEDFLISGRSLEMHELMDQFENRYEIKRLVEGGTFVEYSAHVIPEGGYKGLSKLYGNGILVTGDAAGLALNMGVTVRGMEFAIASGIMAAEAIVKAKEAGDYTEKSLRTYEQALRESFVLKDLAAHAKVSEFLSKKDLYSHYPRQLPDLVRQVMWFGKSPKDRMGQTLWAGLKTSGMLNLRRLIDLYKARNI